MATINILPVSGQKKLEAGKYHSVYQAPADCISVTINARMITMDLTVDSKIRMAIVSSDIYVDNTTNPPDDKYWIQPKDLILGPKGLTVGIFEDSAIILAPGENLVMYSDNDLVVGHVHGLMRTTISI